jgi:hypothetical protein
MNEWCHPDKPPLGLDTDHNATKQDCHVPPYVDTAFAKVAANHPGLVTVAPRFEAHACAAKIDGCRPRLSIVRMWYSVSP